MKLEWYGQACFRLTTTDGVVVMTDPYTPETAGYTDYTEPADLVITSSDNDSFHCRSDLIPGNPVAVNALDVAQGSGQRIEKGVTIHAIEAMEALGKQNPDQNGMYRFELDGLSVGHMGDVGNPLTPAQMEFFKDVDLLLALTGGFPTIALEDLQDLIKHAQPRYVVPMHFRTLRYKPRNSHWLSTFLSMYDEADVDFAFDSVIELDRAKIPDQTRILVLDYRR